MTVLALPKIVSTPDTMSGAPRIDGHRIRVQDVVFWHLHQSHSVEDITRGYDITPAQVHAALAYYYDHREEIDRAIEEQDEAAEELAAKHPSLLTPERIAEFKRKLSGS
ncbi:MAG TPA: DUF433 domain-containing protein [Tepidiformaceae bacterium]|nr:DUF433 domain-containing protein [Tepidiformaceae bacterium]